MKLVNGRTDYHGPYDSWQSWHSREADLCVHVQTHEGDEALICGTRLQPTSARNSSRMEASQAFFWSPLWTLPIHLGGYSLLLDEAVAMHVMVNHIGSFFINKNPCSHFFVIVSCVYGCRWSAFQGLSWWLSSNSEIANRIATEVVTKPETVTLEELFSYIKQEASKKP